jgi:lysozyme
MRAGEEVIRQRLAKQLRSDEGCVLYAYKDTLGYLTLGVGRLIDNRKGGCISEDEAMYMLGNDIERVIGEVNKALPWVKGLNDARQGALYNMAFQLGTGGLLGFTQTLAAIRDEHFDHAADMMLQSKWAEQTPGRAKKMSRQVATGEWQA